MSLLEINVPNKIRSLFSTLKKVILIFGGRSSAKSWSVGLYILLKVITQKTRVLCTRETASSIDKSSFALMQDLIVSRELKGFDIKSDKITYTPNGSTIDFMGLLGHTKADTLTRIKSLEGYDIVWIEEAENTSLKMIGRIHPTVRGVGKHIIYTFNPQREKDPVIEYYETSDEVERIEINYVDNPFCPADIIQHAEKMKTDNLPEYLHVYMGKPQTITEAQIFRGKFRMEEFDTPKDARFYFGSDFGFAKDPTTVGRCFIQQNRLYIDYEAGGIGIDIDKTGDLYAQIPLAKQGIIYADSARPETISYMRRSGWNVEPVKKWAGSVEDGITFLRSFDDIIIHTRCKKTYEEFMLYQYKQDKITGEIFPVPVDKHNHYIDFLRYAISPLIKQRNNNTIEVPTIDIFNDTVNAWE